jgi:hypothetical protein
MHDHVTDLSPTAQTMLSVNLRNVEPQIWVSVFSIYEGQGKTKFIWKIYVLFSTWNQVFKQKFVRFEEKFYVDFRERESQSEDSLETAGRHYEPVPLNYLKCRVELLFKFPGNSGFMYDWVRVTGCRVWRRD